MTFGPAVLDRHVSAFDVAGFVQTSTKPRPRSTPAAERAIKKPDHRHRRLLRARRERPRAAAPPSSVMNSRRLRSGRDACFITRPPHRTARATFPHAAPTSGV